MASDDFDRADDPDLGPNWNVISGLAAFTLGASAHPNSAHVEALGNLSAERYAADTPPDDQESSATLDELEDTLDFGAGPACRMSASDATFYFAFANTHTSGEFQYGKIVAGVVTLLGAYTAGAIPALGQRLAIRAVGDRISTWVDDVEVAFTTDAAIASGNCGVMGQAWNFLGGVDNWVGGSTEPEEQVAELTWLLPVVV